jgi:hypothetical protein
MLLFIHKISNSTLFLNFQMEISLILEKIKYK